MAIKRRLPWSRLKQAGLTPELSDFKVAVKPLTIGFQTFPVGEPAPVMSIVRIRQYYERGRLDLVKDLSTLDLGKFNRHLRRPAPMSAAPTAPTAPASTVPQSEPQPDPVVVSVDIPADSAPDPVSAPKKKILSPVVKAAMRRPAPVMKK